MVAAVGQEAVVEPESHAVADLVAVALVLILVVESFGVGKADVTALAAGDGELRVGGGERLAVEQDMDVAACRDRDPGTGKGMQSRNVAGGGIDADDLPGGCGEYSMCGRRSGIRPQELSPVTSAECALLTPG